MFKTISQTAIDALEQGETIALCTVVRARGSTPRHDGARMIVWEDGRASGTVGGASLEQRVREDAQQAIRENQNQVANYVFSAREDDKDSVGLCGGAVDIFIEVLEPDPILLIAGAGHIAVPLAKMAALLNIEVKLVDDRAEFLTPERFPEATQRELVAYDPDAETLSPLPISITPNTYVVVATWGWDEPVLDQILRHSPAYVSLVASKTKARVIREKLLARGLSEQQTELIRSPAGLNLGAETPAEIALSIMSEVLAVRRHHPTA